METVKYIIKRLLLAVLILFGVSIIIYGLARMMPTDFVDQQFQGQISQGTMTQEDLDRIKELYGLDMPDAYLEITPKDGEYGGTTFTRNTKEVIYQDDVILGGISYAEWYTGTYRADGSKQLNIKAPNSLVFTDGGGNRILCVLNGRYLTVSRGNGEVHDGSYRLPNDNGIDAVQLESRWVTTDGATDYTLSFYRGELTYSAVNVINGTSTQKTYNYSYRGDVELGEGTSKVVTVQDENGEDVIKVQEKFEIVESGKYEIELTDEQVSDLSKIRQVSMEIGTTRIDFNVKYRKASFWDKAASVLKSYFEWLGNLLKGDLGTSFKYKAPVSQVILENMGISFAIAFIATILQFLIAIPLGIKAAVNQYGVVDYTVTIFTMIGISLPTFFLAALFIRVFAVGLGWFEVGGLVSASLAGADVGWFVRLGDMLWHMVLPMAVLVILSIGGLMRYTRTNTLEALNADYVRTARAKGLSERTVIYKHAFRNTLVPLVTLLAGTLPSLFGGAMITETVFAIPGIGKLAYDALVVADVPFIMGYNMFLAIMTVLGTLLSDLMYAVVDPRVKIGK